MQPRYWLLSANRQAPLNSCACRINAPPPVRACVRACARCASVAVLMNLDDGCTLPSRSNTKKVGGRTQQMDKVDVFFVAHGTSLLVLFLTPPGENSEEHYKWSILMVVITKLTTVIV
ncbi:unnamed protein product [Mesocestoides corti]|uniref:G_PROTEIN_RECEP_F1_2 domain-containing protein n=1 Tax=Mesocestoides corti TaxID=53468 RepID=A0A0R3U5X3_MESCO|nr:unnamed protein product [Mesocestoides corti]